jgi:hypothetical protein
MAESNSRLRLLVVFASAALFGCRGAGTTVTTSTNEPARAVPFSAKDLSGYSPEWIAGIAYVGRDRIDAAVTDARLSPSRTGALRVRAILVRGDTARWSITRQSEAVSAERLRALSSNPGDTVRFTLRDTAGEPLAERRLSFLIEGDFQPLPGRGTVTVTRPIHGSLGALATP